MDHTTPEQPQTRTELEQRARIQAKALELRKADPELGQGEAVIRAMEALAVHEPKFMDLEREHILRLEIKVPVYGTDDHVDKCAATIQRILETGLHSHVEVNRIR